MRKAISIIMSVIFALSLTACGSDSVSSSVDSKPMLSEIAQETPSPEVESPTPEPTPAEPRIGVSMPTETLQRWKNDGNSMKELLEAKGYLVDLRYAGDNEVPLQLRQIEEMIDNGCKVLIIAAIDGESLVETLERAKENSIAVISYDRLILNTDALSYYITFDNSAVGIKQVQYIIDRLNLETTEGPYNIELFAEDASSGFSFFRAASVVLEPYFDNGKLTVLSGQTEMSVCEIEGWKSGNAQSRMENLISEHEFGPQKTPLHVVFSPNDSIAQGISAALQAAGYSAENFPILTGQDCTTESCVLMRQGLQSMSVFKNTQKLVADAARMVEQIMTGETVSVNNTSTYDNGTGIIPAFLTEPDICTVKDLGKLVEIGYYTWDQIGGPKGSLPLDYLIE